jgi:hypothetical protein
MELSVEGKTIGMNAFVQKVISGLVQSILDSLDDVPEGSQEVALAYESRAGVEIRVAGQSLRMNEFVQKLTENVLKGILFSLDGVPSDPQNFRLRL